MGCPGGTENALCKQNAVEEPVEIVDTSSDKRWIIRRNSLRRKGYIGVENPVDNVDNIL